MGCPEIGVHYHGQGDRLRKSGTYAESAKETALDAAQLAYDTALGGANLEWTTTVAGAESTFDTTEATAVKDLAVALASYDETYTVALAGHAETADNADAASLAGFWNQLESARSDRYADEAAAWADFRAAGYADQATAVATLATTIDTLPVHNSLRNDSRASGFHKC